MLRGEIDTTEWDVVHARVKSGFQTSIFNRVGAKILEARIRDTYDLRWDLAYPKKNKGAYKDAKAAAGLFKDGTLSGASKAAIESDSDSVQGRVFLEGVWPGFDLIGYEDFQAEPYSTLTYGKDRAEFASDGEINWFQIIEGDDGAVGSAADAIAQFLIDGRSGLSQDLSNVLTGNI